MRVLLTNDDGYRSEGIQTLRKILEPNHEVWIVAPAQEQSGKSHSITVHTAIHIQQISPRHYQAYGSPADCVRLALVSLMEHKPDLILSGINKGENVGTDIIFSGTAGAARQGSLMGVPSVAVSLFDDENPYHFESIALFISENLEILKGLWNRDHFININAPNIDLERAEVVITHPCFRPYRETPHSFKLPNGDMSIFLDGRAEDLDGDSGSDIDTVRHGNISISPIRIHPMQNDPKDYYSARFTVHKKGGVLL